MPKILHYLTQVRASYKKEKKNILTHSFLVSQECTRTHVYRRTTKKNCHFRSSPHLNKKLL